MSDKQRLSGIAIFTVMIAVTIAVVVYVMDNGSNPIGPSPEVSAGGVTSFDVLAESTPGAESVDAVNFPDGNFTVAESTPGTADVELADDVDVSGDISAAEIILNGTIVGSHSSRESLHSTGAGNVSFSARGQVDVRIDTNANGSECFRVIGENVDVLFTVCEDSAGEQNTLMQLGSQSVVCPDSGDGLQANHDFTVTSPLVLVSTEDAEGCIVNINDVGVAHGTTFMAVSVDPDQPITFNDGDGTALLEDFVRRFIFITDHWVDL